MRLLVLLAFAGLALPGPAVAQAKAGEVRIGYQKSSTLSTILKANDTVESTLAPLGLTVRSTPFHLI